MDRNAVIEPFFKLECSDLDLKNKVKSEFEDPNMKSGHDTQPEQHINIQDSCLIVIKPENDYCFCVKCKIECDETCKDETDANPNMTSHTQERDLSPLGNNESLIDMKEELPEENSEDYTYELLFQWEEQEYTNIKEDEKENKESNLCQSEDVTPPNDDRIPPPQTQKVDHNKGMIRVKRENMDKEEHIQVTKKRKLEIISSVDEGGTSTTVTVAKTNSSVNLTEMLQECVSPSQRKRFTCSVCGKSLINLNRHLKTAHGLSGSYREHFPSLVMERIKNKKRKLKRCPLCQKFVVRLDHHLLHTKQHGVISPKRYNEILVQSRKMSKMSIGDKLTAVDKTYEISSGKHLDIGATCNQKMIMSEDEHVRISKKGKLEIGRSIKAGGKSTTVTVIKNQSCVNSTEILQECFSATKCKRFTCTLCGKSLINLNRHLKTAHGLSGSYREHFPSLVMERNKTKKRKLKRCPLCRKFVVRLDHHLLHTKQHGVISQRRYRKILAQSNKMSRISNGYKISTDDKTHENASNSLIDLTPLCNQKYSTIASSAILTSQPREESVQDVEEKDTSSQKQIVCT